MLTLTDIRQCSFFYIFLLCTCANRAACVLFFTMFSFWKKTCSLYSMYTVYEIGRCHNIISWFITNGSQEDKSEEEGQPTLTYEEEAAWRFVRVFRRWGAGSQLLLVHSLSYCRSRIWPCDRSPSCIATWRGCDPSKEKRQTRWSVLVEGHSTCFLVPGGGSIYVYKLFLSSLIIYRLRYCYSRQQRFCHRKL